MADVAGRSAPLRRAVLVWGDVHGRDLPWRHTRDPWAILVSELMLQQTQVARVVPRWRAFLARFPDPPACAAAPAGEVIAHWAGLGYNRRALHLHRTSIVVTEHHGGRLPADLAALLALPGVGPYTARAVMAFAFEADHGVLDTNAARILARTGGRSLRPTEAQGIADALVPGGRSWAWNQAVLDLGATVCTARSPGCGHCPVAEIGACAWWAVGRPEPDPAVGSAGTSGRQPTFAGSDRQGRGRLVAALRAGPVSVAALPSVLGRPADPARAARVAATVVADGLAVDRGDHLTLP